MKQKWPHFASFVIQRKQDWTKLDCPSVQLMTQLIQIGMDKNIPYWSSWDLGMTVVVAVAAVVVAVAGHDFVLTGVDDVDAAVVVVAVVVAAAAAVGGGAGSG
jgi:hypothetical protein